MASFKEAFAETSAIEGGYVDHPDDRGGETYRGIARLFHPTWSGWTRIDAARDDPDFPAVLADDETLARMVADFYKQNFWNRLRGNQIPDQAVAMELFDTAVNMGIGRAVRFLQEALNMLNRNGQSYDEIGVDGLLGKVTLETLKELLASDRGAGNLLALMNLLQGMHFVDVVRAVNTQRAFVRGWLRRVDV
jgi:lysozyme family protein